MRKFKTRSFIYDALFVVIVMVAAMASAVLETGAVLGGLPTLDAVLTQPLVFAQKHRSLSEEQRIIHVLNRLGFGARPGDVERVKAMGLENYINQQLNPEKITDTVAENKLRELSVLNMTTAELYEKYPQPGQLLRQLQARGMVPEEMPADAAKNSCVSSSTSQISNKAGGHSVTNREGFWRTVWRL